MHILYLVFYLLLTASSTLPLSPTHPHEIAARPQQTSRALYKIICLNASRPPFTAYPPPLIRYVYVCLLLSPKSETPLSLSPLLEFKPPPTFHFYGTPVFSIVSKRSLYSFSSLPPTLAFTANAAVGAELSNTRSIRGISSTTVALVAERGHTCLESGYLFCHRTEKQWDPWGRGRALTSPCGFPSRSCFNYFQTTNLQNSNVLSRLWPVIIPFWAIIIATVTRSRVSFVCGSSIALREASICEWMKEALRECGGKSVRNCGRSLLGVRWIWRFRRLILSACQSLCGSPSKSDYNSALARQLSGYWCGLTLE